MPSEDDVSEKSKISIARSGTQTPTTGSADDFTQLAFYMGWPSVFSAMPVVKDVFESREAKK